VIRFAFYLLAALILFLPSCAPHKPVSSKEPPELMIATTSDYHSFLEKAEGLASVVRHLKQKYGDRLLYLDSGDLFQGSLEANLSKGEATVEFLNMLPLDAAAIGNHELDYGPVTPGRVRVLPGEDGLGNLKKRVSEAKFTWMSANFILDPPQGCDPTKEVLCNARGQKTLFKPRKILNRGGYKVGIIGTTTEATAKITRPTFIAGTKFAEMAPVVIAEADFLRKRENCDLILLLTHEGPRRNLAGHYRTDVGILPIFKKLPPNTIDAAICGHSHIQVREEIEGIPVLQAALYGQIVGLMKVQGRNPIQITYEPFIEVPAQSSQADVTRKLARFREAATTLKGKPIGKSTAKFVKNHAIETALGNLIADAVLSGGKSAGDAQFCVLNAGGIRHDLPEGNLTYGDVFKVLPFENFLALVQLKGSELRTMLEIATSGALGDPPISGLKIVRLSVPPGTAGPWDRDLDGNGVQETWERNIIISIEDRDGNPIEDETFYNIATSDYIATGGDYQSHVFDNIPAERIRIYFELPWREVASNYIKAHSPIDPASFYTPERRRILSKPTQ
jgi:5'-nucleotidase